MSFANFSYNQKFFKVVVDSANETFHGATRTEFLVDINPIIVNFRIDTEHRTILEQTVNLCLVLKRSSGFIRNLLKSFVNVVDERLFQCPFKKGTYDVMKARRKSFLNDNKFAENFPSFIQLKGKIYFFYNGSTVVNKKSEYLFNGIDLFEVE